MDRRKATLGAAAVGVVAGVGRHSALVAPAGRGRSVAHPARRRRRRRSSSRCSPRRCPAMSGTVQIDNNLGLPVPGLPAAGQTAPARSGSGRTAANRSRDLDPVGGRRGDHRRRRHDDLRRGTRPAARSPSTRWTTGKHVPGEQATGQPAASRGPATRPRLHEDLVTALEKTSNVSVDGTDTVADRPAYDLVLTPKAGQRTLLREVQIAVDAQTHIPLQLTVLGDNTNTPAVQVGFTSLDVGPQDPSLFHFTLPAGATVTKGDAPAQPSDRRWPASARRSSSADRLGHRASSRSCRSRHHVRRFPRQRQQAQDMVRTSSARRCTARGVRAGSSAPTSATRCSPRTAGSRPGSCRSRCCSRH